MSKILIEGYTPDELLDLPNAAFNEFVFAEEALTFRIWTAKILGRFEFSGTILMAELAQIDGGGEGVLTLLGSVIARSAKRSQLSEIEWRVHTVTCSQRNKKQPRILERRGFEAVDLPRTGAVYHKHEAVLDKVRV